MIIRTHFRPKPNGRNGSKLRVVATTRTGRRVQRTYDGSSFLRQHQDAIFAEDAAAQQFARELLGVADPVVEFDHPTRRGFAYRVVL